MVKFSPNMSGGGLLYADEIPHEPVLLVLHNTVLFPGGVLPMRVGQAAASAIAPSDLVVVSSGVRSPPSQGGGQGVYDFGTVARVVKFERTGDEAEVVVHGLVRCALLGRPEPGSIRVRVRAVAEERSASVWEEKTEVVRALGLRILHRAPVVPAGALELLRDIELPGHLLDLLVANVDLTVAQKQTVLEASPLEQRFAVAIPLLEEVLSRHPELPFEGARCREHGVPATGACVRCGSFVCIGCTEPGGQGTLCRACRARRGPARTGSSSPIERMRWLVDSGVVSVVVGATVLIVQERVPLVGPTGVTAAAVGMLLGATALLRGRSSGARSAVAVVGLALNGAALLR